MCFLRAKPIGLMPMLDQGEQDDKVSAEPRESSSAAMVDYTLCCIRMAAPVQRF